MKLEKSQKVMLIILVIAAFLLVENTLLRPSSVFRYTGIQIYDAVSEFRNLESKGFDVTVTVQGSSEGEPVSLTGKIVETYAGWFVMKSSGAYRIVEGPMGSKDVLASLIYFDVSPRISVEAVYPPGGEGFSLRTGFRKVKGSIAFDGAEVTPTFLQRMRNENEEFYSLTPNRIEVETFGSGFILDIKVPVTVAEVQYLLESVDAKGVQSGYMHYYTGADDEEDIGDVRKDLEAGGAVLVDYHKQR
jgi:hypothetical protein